MLRAYELKMSVREAEEKLPRQLLASLPERDLKLVEWHIVKVSLDARKKEHLKHVYTVDFCVHKDGTEPDILEKRLLKNCKRIRLEKTPVMRYDEVASGESVMKHRPVVVGFGPCGMFAALLLAERGYAPVVLERGKPVEQRMADVEQFWTDGILNEESNVQFGEGGAGTFSDGKLTTRIKDVRVRKVLEELHRAGAGEEILYLQKPHIGTDVLRTVVKNLRLRILELGGEIRFQSRLTGIETAEAADGSRRLLAAEVNAAQRLETENMILALGHSARDTFRMLRNAGVEMRQKPFSMGVRIEHKQTEVDLAQYGCSREESHLPPAEYQLSCRCKNGRGVYTFCMCPGGEVVAAASQRGGVVVNGMSSSSRNGENANSAVLVDVRTEDFGSEDVLAGVLFQEKYEALAYEAGGRSYKAPAQRVKEFLENESDSGTDAGAVRPTYRPGVVYTDLAGCLPDFVAEGLREAIPVFGKKLKGFDAPESLLTGIETRSSSPVRLLRDENLMCNLKGLYPGGEGAGYAGGIVSAAVDGIKLAEQIIRKYRPWGNYK